MRTTNEFELLKKVLLAPAQRKFFKRLRKLAVKVDTCTESESAASEVDGELFQAESQASLLRLIDVTSEVDRRLMIGILNRRSDDQLK